MQWIGGAAREDVTCFEPGIQLFGWGMPKNIAEGVATPMYSRALVLSAGASSTAIVLVDIGTITLTLRRAAIERLREIAPECDVPDESIFITATHTHSGPSGYSEYLFYGFSGPALSASIVGTYANGIASAIAKAWREREHVEVRVADGEMPLATPIAFNRSLHPYLQNSEVAGAKLSSEEATRRVMTMLRVDRASDRTPLAVVSWFATHATSIHSDQTKIHGDNRGLAALSLEARLSKESGRDVVAMFPQEAAGDVTPNFRPDRKRKLVVGMCDDDHESALFVAKALCDLAHSIYRESSTQPVEPATISCSLRYVHMSGRLVNTSTPTGKQARLGDAVMGLGFVEGTKEGPGPLQAVHPLMRKVTNWLRRTRKGRGRQLAARHGNKIPFLDTGKGVEGRLVGTFSLKHPVLPGAFDPTVATYKRYMATGALDDNPWTPTTLPFQALKIGNLGIFTVPGEPTTMTGQRIREAIYQELGACAPEKTVIAGYSNDYTSYITTEEEYYEQWYEGASTLFGPYTQLAMQEILTDLAKHIWKGQSLTLPNDSPPSFRKDLYELRKFVGVLPSH